MKKTMAVGGGGKGGTAATDLLVCFPARQHLALMPKPICSPSRTTMDKAAAARRRQLQLPGASAAAGGGRARGSSSAMFWGSKARQRPEEEEEPQSPKVTCAGQIKAGRPRKVKPGSEAATKHGKGGAKSWLAVVEEIERLRGRRKKVGWLETLGIRRDALPFLGGALRSLRSKACCFGSLHAGAAAVDSSVDSDHDAGERGSEHGAGGSAAASVFSKWLMVLEGGQEPMEQDETSLDHGQEEDVELERQQCEETAPPPNALLLMRCRSAPARGRLSVSRTRRECEQLAGEVDQEKEAADGMPGDGETEDELVFLSTAPGFMKLSLDIAKETWVVGGGADPIARSRSWKR
ncbi:uncharacterized protein [Zea mays]|jgi:hypothetical protein|uniref:Uncharacterized protein n=1 Tax=Zea mays TaxID=4577 RepID=A0A1D6I3A7_MAIZE|nr:uncharacterized protein LOC103632656 [Zea mays]ONM54639.1 hypothetical protein ZEAMMB73_Zm00001d020273 [Zea mays]|eukprot:XP_008652635.1 uncharacterized protein LOC103632656 [Zea mays]